MPRSPVGIGMLVGLLLGGLAGAALGLWLAGSRPGGEVAPLLLGAFLSGFGLICGAVMGAVFALANRLLGQRPVRPGTPEADYRELPGPPIDPRF